MANGEEVADSPDEFLKALAGRLKGAVGVDDGIAGILEAHILKATPTQNAVSQAKDAILKLAAERASSPKPGGDNG
jgi:hypothetical protein